MSKTPENEVLGSRGDVVPHRARASGRRALAGVGALITGGSRGWGWGWGRAGAPRRAGRARRARAESAARGDGGGPGGGRRGPRDRGDVAAPGAAQAIAAQAAALVGPIELLINNASALGPTPMPLLLDLEPDAFAEVLRTNVRAPFELTRAVAGAMLVRGRGVVVNISSDAGAEAYPGWGAYGVSKAALDHLTRSWSVELADAGVRVFSVDPGEMDTVMHAAALPEADRAALAEPDEVARRIVEMIETPARARSGARLLASSWRGGAVVEAQRGGAA
ncbi:MAG: SDR family oxidoreductase [Myxococcales bacterium]|nr:SDR family oxidoreductase [Myxococcales bacterium]